MKTLLDIAGIKLSRDYATDLEYNSLLTSKNVERISAGLAELQEQILELEQIKDDGNKTKVLLHRIRALKLKASMIEKRVSAIMNNRITKIENRRKDRDESKVIETLLKVKFQQPRSREEKVENKNKKIKSDMPSPAALQKIAIETAIKMGVDVRTLNHEAVIEAGYGDMLNKSLADQYPDAEIPDEYDITLENHDIHDVLSNLSVSGAVNTPALFDPNENIFGESPEEIAAREERLRKSIGQLDVQINNFEKKAS